MIAAADYARFLGTEYLDQFVASGGSTVKFVVPADEEAAGAFSAALLARSVAAGYVAVQVDAVATRIHLMDQVFFEIARKTDWAGLARRSARSALAEAGYRIATDQDDLAVEAVAARHGVDATELARDVNRHLQQRIMVDYAMVREFRIAMLRLCQAELATGQVSPSERAAVLGWLTGDLRQMSLLKSALIFRRTGRHNARELLFSLAHWLGVNGATGIVLELDVRRLGFARRPLPEERDGFYYTKAALLDAYELLRQLVDNTDELARCCIVVIAAPEFLTDDNRGVSAYQALKLRIYDEVRDRARDNPYSSLVRLGAS